MYSRTTFLAASGLGAGLTVGARPDSRGLERMGICSGYIQRNANLGTLRKFPGALRQTRRQVIPAAHSDRTAA